MESEREGNLYQGIGAHPQKVPGGDRPLTYIPFYFFTLSTLMGGEGRACLPCLPPRNTVRGRQARRTCLCVSVRRQVAAQAGEVGGL